MADALTTITHLIQSPPGQLAAGGVLAGIVWKFFERVESVLTHQTKLEIAVWLVGRKKFGPRLRNWPDTFAKVFARVFGAKHLSWTCFWRSVLASFAFGVLAAVFVTPYLKSSLVPTLLPYPYFGLPLWKRMLELVKQSACLFMIKALADYVAVLFTRLAIQLMSKTRLAVGWIALIITDFVLTFYLSMLGIVLGNIVDGFVLTHVFPYYHVVPSLGGQDLLNLAVQIPAKPFMFLRAVAKTATILPLIGSSSVTSVWLWLYAGSGFLLKAARRLDIGFDWFNRHFDIEKKPLQSIGLVAGALVALVYWAAVVVGHLV